MTYTLIEQIKADAEKGTKGGWHWEQDEDNDWCLSPGVILTDYNDGTPGGDEIDKANARRIARVPQMEARILADAEEKAARQWQPIETIPYDQTVLLGWTDGSIDQGFWYDETFEEFMSVRKRKPFHDDDPWVVPYCWMPEPDLPEPPALTSIGDSDE